MGHSAMKQDTPLGLPKGSVRALLAIGIWVCIALLMFINREVPDNVWTIGGMIIAFYFGTRVTK